MEYIDNLYEELDYYDDKIAEAEASGDYIAVDALEYEREKAVIRLNYALSVESNEVEYDEDEESFEF